MTKTNKYWFKPKRYGYGATPISWEGWAMTLVFAFLVTLLAIYAVKTQNLAITLISFLTLLIIIVFISKIKTKEKWKWRWGN